MKSLHMDDFSPCPVIDDGCSPISIVFIGSGGIDSTAVLRSSGVVAARRSIWAHGYLEHAYFPEADWRPLKQEERSLLFRGESVDFAREVMVINMRGPKFDALARKVTSYGHAAAMREDIHADFKEVLSSHVDIVGSYHYLGAETTSDSAPTLTWEVDGRRTGLHVDSWFNFPIENRWASPNRLCLNLGQGDRYLFFINRGINEIREILDKSDSLDSPNGENVTTLTESFLNLAPRSPVYAVRVRAGEAYVAPTECLIHDGFVPGRLPNATISVMGYISPTHKV